MSAERRARLEQAAGDRLSAHDLDMIAYLAIRSQAVAEHVIWDDRDAVLSSLPELIRAMDTEPDTSGRVRYARLQSWRDGHDDADVRSVSDADLGRLATAPIGSAEDIGRAAVMLARGAVLVRYADQLLDVMGIQRDRPAPAPEPAPAPGPAAAEAPAPRPQPSPQPVPELAPDAALPDPSKPFEWVTVARFKPYDWNAGTAQPVGHVVATTVGDEVQIEYEWHSAPAANVTIYRIVQSAESWPTGAPDLASPVGTTLATAGSVQLHPRGRVTYLAVWANQGRSLLEASQTQPVLIGSSEIAWPPTGFTVNATADDAVAGSWRAPEGSRVEVQRFPQGVPVAYDQARLIASDTVYPSGFLDRDPILGEPITYAAFCVADLPAGGSATSAPATAEIEIVPDAEPIRLDVKRSTQVTGGYDITWIPPRHGRVVLYATRQRPPQGLENETRTREIIESQGLTPEHKITYPVEDLGGIRTVRGYVVDRTWVRSHFVAVHWVSDEAVRVGEPVSMVTPRAPEWAEVVERVDAQILSFPWPAGVSIVEAYQGPRRSELDPTANDPVASLTREEYDQTGGMRITRSLPSNGCSLHLFGVVYLEGRPVYSPPVTIDYPGITRLRYEVVPTLANHQEAPPGAQPAFYRLYATVDDELHGVPITLVGNEQRLPLSPSDGTLLQGGPVSLAPGQRVYVGDVGAGPRQMWVRLFVDQPAAETGGVAVLDPHVGYLWVGVNQ